MNPNCVDTHNQLHFALDFVFKTLETPEMAYSTTLEPEKGLHFSEPAVKTPGVRRENSV